MMTVEAINRVPDDVIESFFRNYLEFCKAWGRTKPDRTYIFNGKINANACHY